MAFLARARKVDLVLLAEELGERVPPDAKVIDLKNVIIGSSHFEEEWVKGMMETIIEERQEREKEQQESEREKEKNKFELEQLKLRLETEERIEIERIRAGKATESPIRGATPVSDPGGRTLEDVLRTVKLLTVKVPREPEGWSFFFSSLEKAFSSEEVEERYKSKILLSLLGERTADLLTQIDGDKYGNYEALKDLVLKEFEPPPHACRENFEGAKRSQEETYVQFATRLTAMWEYYCRRREATDMASVNQLIVADKLFATLDAETATHIGVRQQEGWFKPRELGKEVDTFLAAKRKSQEPFRVRKGEGPKKNVECQRAAEPKSPKGQARWDGRGGGCFTCGSRSHLKRDCPKQRHGQNAVSVHRVNAEENESDEDSDRVVIATVRMLKHSNQFPKLCKLQKVKLSANGKAVEALVDSGSEITVIREDLIPGIPTEGAPNIFLKGIFGPPVKCPLVRVPLGRARGGGANVVHQEVLCAVAPALVEEVVLPPKILGILEGIKGAGGSGRAAEEESVISQRDESDTEAEVVATEGTLRFGGPPFDHIESGRGIAGAREETETAIGKNDMSQDQETTSQRFLRKQRKRVTVSSARRDVEENKGNFFVANDFQFHRDKVLGGKVGQLRVPKSRRVDILKLAHASVFGGLRGVKKTLQRNRYSSCRESMRNELQNFCDACKEYQLTRPVKVKGRAPMTSVARPELPFHMGKVGMRRPKEPPRSKGHKSAKLTRDC